MLCYFQLAVARCANARLSSVSLLLAPQLKINQAKIRKKFESVCAGEQRGLVVPPWVFFPFFSPMVAAITVTLLCDRVCVCQSVGSATRTVLD